MIFKVNKVVINRYKCPSNPSLDEHIQSTQVENVGKFKSPFIPQLNEILIIDNNKYLVKNIIRKIPDMPDFMDEEFIIDVVDLPETHLKKWGSISWNEPICLSINPPIA